LYKHVVELLVGSREDERKRLLDATDNDDNMNGKTKKSKRSSNERPTDYAQARDVSAQKIKLKVLLIRVGG